MESTWIFAKGVAGIQIIKYLIVHYVAHKLSQTKISPYRYVQSMKLKCMQPIS